MANADAKPRVEAIAAVQEIAKKDERELTYLNVVLAACRIYEPNLDPIKIGKKVDEIAQRAKEDAAKATTGSAKIAAVNKVIYEEFGFGPDKSAAKSQISGEGALDASLLNRVLERKVGICLGLSTIYLVVAERAGLPVYAVHAPGHIFCRYDDGKEKFNIECTAGGKTLTDAMVCRVTGATPAARSNPNSPYFRAVGKKGVLSDQLNNLAYDLASRKEGPAPFTMQQLADLIDLAVKLEPNCHDVLDSAALIHFKNGEAVRALAICDQAVALSKEFGTKQEVSDEYEKRHKEYEEAAKVKQPAAK
ncbi:MAG: hypothetical protein HY291_10965 [Planctomycetes bacterium]|nr:hypothetical protein [Planctomycetota bacterium]